MFAKTNWVVKILGGGFLAIMAILPFHALITTWAISNFGHETIIKSWKELLLIGVLLPLSLYALIKNPKIFKTIWQRTINKLLFAYVALNCVLVLLMSNGMRSEVAGLVFNLRFFAMFIFAQLLLELLPTEKLKDITLKIVFAGGLVVVAFGALQVLLLPADFLRHFGYSANIIPPYFTVDNNEAIVRILSTLRGPNALGAYLIFWLPILAYITQKVWGLPSSRKPHSSSSQTISAANSFSSLDVYTNTSHSEKAVFARANLPIKQVKSSDEANRQNWQIWTVLVWAASLLTLYGSRSRSAWLGVCVALFIFTFMQLKSFYKKQLIIGTLVAFGAFFAIILWQWNGVFVQSTLLHRDPAESSNINSDEQRSSSIQHAIKSVVNHPFGQGPGSSGLASTYGVNSSIVENYYLQVATELGVLGLILFIAINVLVFILLWSRRQEVIALALCAGFIGLVLANLLLPAWGDETVSMLWWGMAGIAAFAPLVKKPKKRAKL